MQRLNEVDIEKNPQTFEVTFGDPEQAHTIKAVGWDDWKTLKKKLHHERLRSSQLRFLYNKTKRFLKDAKSDIDYKQKQLNSYHKATQEKDKAIKEMVDEINRLNNINANDKKARETENQTRKDLEQYRDTLLDQRRELQDEVKSMSSKFKFATLLALISVLINLGLLIAWILIK